MRYVLDASAMIPAFVAEPNSVTAQRLIDDYRLGIHELLAPDFFLPEVLNAFLVAERAGRLPAGGGVLALQSLMGFLPQLYASEPLAARAFAIAEQHRLAVYDCLYVALAEQFGCELVTNDTKMIRALKPVFPFLMDLTLLP